MSSLFPTHKLGLALDSQYPKNYWGNLSGSTSALAITQAAIEHQKLVTVIIPDSATLFRLQAELQFYCQAQAIDILAFPDWETLPYDLFSVHQDIISERLLTLYKLLNLQQGIILIAANTLLLRTPPVDYLQQNCLIFRRNQIIDLTQVKAYLLQAGYLAVDQVMAHGEFANRGSILDLFPMGSDQPYRIDFFDNEIDSIRFVDIDSQRSSQVIDKIEILPAREFPTDENAIELFRQTYRQKFTIRKENESLYRQVSKQIFPGGIEYYLPMFFTHTGTFLDYLSADTLMVSYQGLNNYSDTFWESLQHRYEERRYDQLRPILPPEQLYLPTETLMQMIKGYPQLILSTEPFTSRPSVPASAKDLCQHPLPDLTIKAQSKQPYAAIQAFIEQQLAKGLGIVVVCESEGRRETIRELLIEAQLHPHLSTDFYEALQQQQLTLVVGELQQGFWLDLSPPWIVLTEGDILGHKLNPRRHKKVTATNTDNVIKNLVELSVGQFVVHLDHGIGQYMGLQTLDVGGLQAEFLTIQYANDAKLYVPVSSLYMITRYAGADQEHVQLHKLGNDTWEKTKKRAAEKIKDVAAELLELYAQRAAKTGDAYINDPEQYHLFCQGFSYQETPDQQQAITTVLDDLLSEQMMDRLVCGDVGFGKTEVAMRAAFVTANMGKQVCILVPTTLLAQQHYDNFVDRFAHWPIKIDVLSRFKTASQQKQTLIALANGTIDIIIGTHKLLNADIKYQDLGLLIIDEEHRFGVKQKEKIKQLRTNINILTLTATPIPRTLNMAMSGMRDLSIIATPPERRLAIKTFVQQSNKALIKEAISREINRGGQVYYLHNNVETIDKVATELSETLPQALISVAHGQMRERELEQIMSDFYHHRYNVLVCTTIIETGIDIPSANTIIMDRADRLGLAQLHQLRGRVGRSHHQAYAYLLTPHPKRMTKDAIKRLEAIASLEELGAGFTLATHDLEIRGAGELLGEEQSGQIHSIGFSLYTDMLEQAVAALKAGKLPTLDQLTAKQSEIELRIPALIPDDYIYDVNQRLSFYKQIASCQNNQQLKESQIELIDRFGLLPDPVKNIFQLAELKLQANTLKIKKIELLAKGIQVDFGADPNIELEKLLKLIQTYPKDYRFDGATRLKYLQPIDDHQQKLKWVRKFLHYFLN